jgi:acetamidase/formamidase
MGSDEDLTVATRIAVEQTITFLMETRGLDRGAAYALTSLAVDLRITQLVDGYVGVHAMIPKSIFTR